MGTSSTNENPNKAGSFETSLPSIILKDLPLAASQLELLRVNCLACVATRQWAIFGTTLRRTPHKISGVIMDLRMQSS